MNYDEILGFLRNSFKGLPYLMQTAKKIKNIYYKTKDKKSLSPQNV